jgi:hypothetical protein
VAYREAIDLAPAEPQRRYFERRLREVTSTGPDTTPRR